MQESEFEKQVQKKMDQLNFDPSAAVWVNVNREINKGRKRMPLFWILALTGSVLLVTGYYFIAGSQHSQTAVHPPAAIPVKSSSGISLPQSTMAESSLLKMQRQIPGQFKTGSGDAGLVYANEAAHRKIEQNAHFATSPEKQIDDPITGSSNEGASSASAGTHQIQNTDSPVSDSVGKSNTAGTVVTTTSQEENTAETKNKKESSWKIGFTAGAGVSGLHNTLSDQNYSTTYAPGNANSGAYNPYYYNPEITDAVAFNAGVFFSKTLSASVSASAGLNYHYYSMKINTGDHSHLNQFQFVELPVNIDLTINKSTVHPIIWEAGLSFAYLIASNALMYDPSAAVYNNKSDLSSKGQWNAVTAVLFGFSQGKNKWMVGPQALLGISEFSGTPASGSQHLFSCGLKFVFIPGKK